MASLSKGKSIQYYTDHEVRKSHSSSSPIIMSENQTGRRRLTRFHPCSFIIIEFRNALLQIQRGVILVPTKKLQYERGIYIDRSNEKIFWPEVGKKFLAPQCLGHPIIKMVQIKRKKSDLNRLITKIAQIKFYLFKFDPMAPEHAKIENCRLAALTGK